MKHTEDFLSIKKPVGNQSNDKWSNDGSKGLGRKRRWYLSTGSSQIVAQESPQGNEPRAPDKKLQKHHQWQLDSYRSIHNLSQGLGISKFIEINTE